MIYITGDTHGFEFKKLNSDNFPQNKDLTKNDYVIITGDFGLVWNNNPEELFWRQWLERKNFTTLFIDGNHENFEMLNKYPIESWNGGNVRKISDSIIHLMRGQVFTIDDKKIFTFGGATSVDKLYRKEGISWWEQELPNVKEMNEGLDNLKKHNNKVDYILTHTTSTSTLNILGKYYNFIPEYDTLTNYFDIISNEIEYTHWYFGHFHQDLEIIEKQTVTYNKIHEIKRE